MLLFKLVSAQDGNKKTLTVNFQQAKIEQFVSDLESKTGYHFTITPCSLTA